MAGIVESAMPRELPDTITARTAVCYREAVIARAVMSSLMLTATINSFSAPPSESPSRNLPGKVVALLTFGTVTSFEIQKRGEGQRKMDLPEATFAQTHAQSKRVEFVQRRAGFPPPERWGINE